MHVRPGECQFNPFRDFIKCSTRSPPQGLSLAKLLSSAMAESHSQSKPVVIGLYGISGCGKSYYLKLLKRRLGEERFTFHDGSALIDSIYHPGLEAFKQLPETEKIYWREFAIDNVRQACSETGKVAIVTGHLMFWNESDSEGLRIHTQKDMDTYTHIIYLHVDPVIIMLRRHLDKERTRELASVAHLKRWQTSERAQLRTLCNKHGILYVSRIVPRLKDPHNPLEPLSSELDHLETLIRDFSTNTEALNLLQVERKVDKIVSTARDKLETMLVLDADKTLSESDTGAMFWTRVFWDVEDIPSFGSPLDSVFSGPLGYSYQAFRQAMLLYEDWSDSDKFETICDQMTGDINLYPEIVSLLHRVASEDHVGAVIVTCGLAYVWERILQNANLADKVKVIGGCRFSEGYVVTPEVKGAVVSRLREKHGLYVWAFGDSPLDLAMMEKANRAIVVVGNERSRSKSMEAALEKSVDGGAMPEIHQVVFPKTAAPRLGGIKVKPIELSDPELQQLMLARRPARLEFHHATTKAAAKLLMSPMRDATNSGPILRKTHVSVGRYLAMEFLSDIIGLEEYPIPHVQGHIDKAFRLAHEKDTLIVALMRGGEPMAFGVNEVFPMASFLHANSAADIELRHVEGKRNLILVDSVINSGKTVIEFVRHIHKINKHIHVVVVAGVIQAQCMVTGSNLARALYPLGNVKFVALRTSDNKFTGEKTTDTGNRLFNTTDLD